jgi:excisionase family DNA binding protein
MSDKLNYKQAAELLGVPVGTLYAWVFQGKIPHHRFGKRLVRFLKQDLDIWAAKHRVEENYRDPSAHAAGGGNRG